MSNIKQTFLTKISYSVKMFQLVSKYCQPMCFSFLALKLLFTATSKILPFRYSAEILPSYPCNFQNNFGDNKPMLDDWYWPVTRTKRLPVNFHCIWPFSCAMFFSQNKWSVVELLKVYLGKTAELIRHWITAKHYSGISKKTQKSLKYVFANIQRDIIWKIDSRRAIHSRDRSRNQR